MCSSSNMLYLPDSENLQVLINILKLHSSGCVLFNVVYYTCVQTTMCRHFVSHRHCGSLIK